MEKIKQIVIKLEQVSKIFVLYPNPIFQMLGYLGLLSSKNFQRKKAVSNANLTITEGEKVGIIGHNGSGKTTMLRLMTGLTEASDGNIVLPGSVQTLMQKGYGFNDSLSGAQNIKNALVFNQVPQAKIEEMMRDIVEFVELGEFLQHPIKTYSLGMRARLEFATATAIYPDVLVIDEVLGAGDGYFIQKCAKRMQNLVKDTTLILVSHSIEQIRQYCDRGIWLKDGIIQKDGPVEDVVNSYISAINDTKQGAVSPSPSAQNKKLGLLSEVQISELFFSKLAHSGYQFITDSSIKISLIEPSGVFAQTSVGAPISLTIEASCSASCQFFILGFSQDSALIFSIEVPLKYKRGEHQIQIATDKFEVGVGEYVLVPAIRPINDQEIFLGNEYVNLRVLEGNWSEPPLVHFHANWVCEDEKSSISSRVSSWI